MSSQLKTGPVADSNKNKALSPQICRSFGCRGVVVGGEGGGRGDGDGDGEAAVRAGVGGGGAAVDGGDGGDDGQAESVAVVGGAVVEPLEGSEDALGIGLADEWAGVGDR